MTQFVLVHGTTQSPAGWDHLAVELRWALGTLRLFNPGPAVYQHPPTALPAGALRGSR